MATQLKLGTKLIGGICILAGMATADETNVVLAAAAAPMSAVLDVSAFSAYVVRGQVVNDEAVVQPALTITRRALTLSVWGNLNLTDQAAVTEDAPAFSEVDLTLSYTHQAGPLVITGGWVEYLYPNTTVAVTNVPQVGELGSACRATREVFLTMSVPGGCLVPSVSVYRDIDEVDGTYVTAGLAWSHALSAKVTLTLCGSVGYGDEAYNACLFGVERAGWNDGNVGASLSWAVSDALTITPSIQYETLLDGDIKDAAGTVYRDDQSVWGGVTVSWIL